MLSHHLSPTAAYAPTSLSDTRRTLEVRGTRYAGRTFLLGCRGKIYARAIFGEPLRIQTLEKKLRPPPNASHYYWK